MAENTYDAIVVGSGISGGWAAKELTEKGLKVLLLERGRDIKHVKDYVNATKGPWEFPHRGGRTQEMIKDYPVLRRDYPLNEVNLDFWVKDKECPYTEVKRFDWFRGYHVGGRSLMWGRQSYRWSDIDFEANGKEGIAVLPDGQFVPPMELNCVEKDVADRLRKYYNDKRRLIIGRTANTTVP